MEAATARQLFERSAIWPPGNSDANARAAKGWVCLLRCSFKLAEGGSTEPTASDVLITCFGRPKTVVDAAWGARLVLQAKWAQLGVTPMFALTAAGSLAVYSCCRCGLLLESWHMLLDVTRALEARCIGTGIHDVYLWPVAKNTLNCLLHTAQVCRTSDNSFPTLDAVLKTDPVVLNLIALASVTSDPVASTDMAIQKILADQNTVFLLLPLSEGGRLPLPPPPTPYPSSLAEMFLGADSVA